MTLADWFSLAFLVVNIVFVLVTWRLYPVLLDIRTWLADIYKLLSEWSDR